MLEVEIATECNHIFVKRIESVLNPPTKGDPIKCQVCRRDTTIRTAGIPGRVREPKPTPGNQTQLPKE